MNPFDAPPSTPAVSLDPPVEPPARRRGRTVAIVLGTAGVIGAGIVGVSQLASADDPELDVVAAPEPAEEPADEEPAEEPADEPADDGDESGPDGELRIEVGDDDPIVLDLGDLFGGEGSGAFLECIDLPVLDVLGEGGAGELDLAIGDLLADGEIQAWLEELGELGAPGELGSPFEMGTWDFGDHVTVTGDDGVTIIDLGDGDASVTIERDGETGELTVTTDGTATARDLAEVFGDFEHDFEHDFELPPLPEGELPHLGPGGFDRLEECLAELGE